MYRTGILDVSDDEEEVYKPRKRARVTRSQSRLRAKGKATRSSSEESSASDMNEFVVPDSVVDEESEAELDDDEQGCDPFDGGGPNSPAEFRSLSQLSAGSPMESTADLFRTYVKGHVLTFLDSKLRDALIGKAVLPEYRRQIASLKSAIRRVELDTVRSRATEFVADGRWRDVLRALEYRPFIAYFYGHLDILPHPVDLQSNLAVYW
jgi:hypothetical protein